MEETKLIQGTSVYVLRTTVGDKISGCKRRLFFGRIVVFLLKTTSFFEVINTATIVATLV